MLLLNKLHLSIGNVHIRFVVRSHCPVCTPHRTDYATLSQDDTRACGIILQSLGTSGDAPNDGTNSPQRAASGVDLQGGLVLDDVDDPLMLQTPEGMVRSVIDLLPLLCVVTA